MDGIAIQFEMFERFQGGLTTLEDPQKRLHICINVPTARSDLTSEFPSNVTGSHPCGSKWTTPQHSWLEFSNQICASFGTLSLMLLYPHPVLAMSPSDACLPNDECLRTRSCVLPVSWPTRHRPSGICFSGLKLIQSWGVLTSILLNDGLVSIPIGKTKQQFNTQKHKDAVFNKAHSSKNNETNIFTAVHCNQSMDLPMDLLSFQPPRHPRRLLLLA